MNEQCWRHLRGRALVPLPVKTNYETFPLLCNLDWESRDVLSMPDPHPHRRPLIQGWVAGAAAQAGGPRLPFPGPH